MEFITHPTTGFPLQIAAARCRESLPGDITIPHQMLARETHHTTVVRTGHQSGPADITTVTTGVEFQTFRETTGPQPLAGSSGCGHKEVPLASCLPGSFDDRACAAVTPSHRTTWHCRQMGEDLVR